MRRPTLHLPRGIAVYDVSAENVKGESCLIANPLLMYREIIQGVLHYTSQGTLTFWRRNYFFFNFSTPCI